MKINFRIKKVINAQPEIAVNKIMSYLKKKGYKIIEQTANTIIFDNDVFRVTVASKSDYYTKVDDGKFEISVNQGTVLNLFYRVSIFREFVFLSVILMAGIYIDYKILFLSIPFMFNFLYKIYYLNTHILSDIINS